MKAPTADPVRPKLQSVNNFRDLNQSCSSIRPGLIYRSAQPVKATEEDVALLYRQLGIKELIDLRSSEEVAQDPSTSTVWQDVSFCRYRYSRTTQRVLPDPTSTVMAGTDIMHSQVSLLERKTFLYAVLSRLTLPDALYVLGTGVISPQKSKARAIQRINEGGLELLYEIIIDTSRAQLAAALRLVLQSVQAGRPVMFFCRAGKDRTGLLAAIVLSIMNATDEQIVQDYHKSDEFHVVALAGLEHEDEIRALDKAKFERAPRHAMQHALGYMRNVAGSVQMYLEQYCGFTLAEQEQLRQLLQQPSGSSRL